MEYIRIFGRFIIKHKKIVSLFFLVFIVYYYIFPLFTLINIAKGMSQKVNILKHELAQKDKKFLDLTINYLLEDTKTVSTLMKRYYVFKVLPFIGVYVSDLESVNSILIEAINVFDELSRAQELSVPSIRFDGWSDDKTILQATNLPAKNTSATIEELVDNKSLYKTNLINILKNLEKINVEKYPKEIMGINVIDFYDTLRGILRDFVLYYDDTFDALKFSPYILGEESPKSYLLVLLDKNEMTPGGGMPVLYMNMSISNGTITFNKVGNLKKFYAPEKLKGLTSSVLVNGNAVTTKNFASESLNISSLDAIFFVDNSLVYQVLDALNANSSETERTKLYNMFDQYINNPNDLNSKGVLYQLFVLSLQRLETMDVISKMRILRLSLDSIKSKDFSVFFFNEDVQKTLDTFYNIDAVL